MKKDKKIKNINKAKPKNQQSQPKNAQPKN